MSELCHILLSHPCRYVLACYMGLVDGSKGFTSFTSGLRLTPHALLQLQMLLGKCALSIQASSIWHNNLCCAYIAKYSMNLGFIKPHQINNYVLALWSYIIVHILDIRISSFMSSCGSAIIISLNANLSSCSKGYLPRGALENNSHINFLTLILYLWPSQVPTEWGCCHG